MPWCEPCAKYFSPNSMNDDGTCPSCGELIEEHETAVTARARRSKTDAANAAENDEKAPWHFKLLVGMTVVYLTWRFVQFFTG